MGAAVTALVLVVVHRVEIGRGWRSSRKRSCMRVCSHQALPSQATGPVGYEHKAAVQSCEGRPVVGPRAGGVMLPS